MKKKVVSLLATMTLAVSALAGCGAAADSTADTTAAENTQTAAAEDTAATQEAADTTAATAGLKAGFIFLHDEQEEWNHFPSMQWQLQKRHVRSLVWSA